MDDEKTDLYRAYNERGELLYIGISLSAISRSVGHQNQSGWFEHLARLDVERYATRAEALEAEKAAIRSEKPKYNVVHSVIAPPPRSERKRRTVKATQRDRERLSKVETLPEHLQGVDPSRIIRTWVSRVREWSYSVLPEPRVIYRDPPSPRRAAEVKPKKDNGPSLVVNYDPKSRATVRALGYDDALFSDAECAQIAARAA